MPLPARRSRPPRSARATQREAVAEAAAGERADVERAVVGEGRAGDAREPAVEPGVANDREVQVAFRALSVDVDGRRHRRRSRAEREPGRRVPRAADEPLGRAPRADAADHLGVETHAAHQQEAPRRPVLECRAPYVEACGARAGEEGERPCGAARHAGLLRPDVGGARRDDAERGCGPGEALHHLVHSAVAAGGDDGVVAARGRRRGDPRRVARAGRRLDVEAPAALDERRGGLAERGFRGRTAGFRVAQQQHATG